MNDPSPICLARHAMATRFELVLHGDNPQRLRAAGEEVLDEIDRLEQQLSLFRPTSEIAHVNSRAAREPVRVSPEVFQLLQRALTLQAETGGAFDITVAPLVRCWGFMGGTGRVPGPEELARARECVGGHLVHLDPKEFAVSFSRPGVMVDLGAIGKGYAVERCAWLLKEQGVKSAFFHGGTSTAYALGRQPDGKPWRVEVDIAETAALPAFVESQDQKEKRTTFAIDLDDAALSVSGVRGKFFEQDGRPIGHVLDPRSGQPVSEALVAAVVLPSATETDALSTALLVGGTQVYQAIAGSRPRMATLLATPAAILNTGSWVE